MAEGDGLKARESALGVNEALEAMIDGRLTAATAVRKALSAAADCRRDINAFSVLAEDAAISEAMLNDERRQQHQARPLEGIPIAVKDLIDTSGLETRYGSAAYLDHIPMQDAEIVRQLKDLGAIVIGKTTTHEFAWGVTTSHPRFGHTLNPVRPAHIPGGSSGGAAASVRYGAVAAGLGTDTGGSVRIPAALCGVVGFKPSYGRLSAEGIFPLSPSLDHPGLIGQSVADVLAIASALGFDISEPKDTPRIGVIGGISPVPMASNVASAFGGAVAPLRRHFDVLEASAGSIFDQTFATFATIVLAEASMNHFGRHSAETIATSFSAETIDRLSRAQTMTIGDYAAAQERRAAFASELRTFMTPFDFIVLPTCPCTAPRIGEAALEIGNWKGDIRQALMTYTAPFNLTGLPAISVPLPTPPGDLPIGLQIVGHRGDDGGVLAMAKRVAAILSL